MIFIVQVGLGIYQHTMGYNEIRHELVSEVLKDMIIFLRINDKASWIIWELYAVSNLSYYYILTRTNKLMGNSFKNSEKV